MVAGLRGDYHAEATSALEGLDILGIVVPVRNYSQTPTGGRA